jgi:hypothetical protein
VDKDGLMQVFTFLTKNSADYAEFLLASMKRNQVMSGVKYCCIKSFECDRIPNGWDYVADVSDVSGELVNSARHALAMHKAMEHFASDEIVYVDADIYIFYKGWDKVVHSQLQKHGVFGFESNTKRTGGFPTVYFFAFQRVVGKYLHFGVETEINRRGALAVRRFKIETYRQTEMYGMPIGAQVKCDTGWKLRSDCVCNGFSWNTIPHISALSDFRQMPITCQDDADILNLYPGHQDEWHWEGKLFGTHKQASRSHGFETPEALSWRRRIKAYEAGYAVRKE